MVVRWLQCGDDSLKEVQDTLQQQVDSPPFPMFSYATNRVVSRSSSVS